MTRPILIYDAQCRFCLLSKRLMAQWDRNGQIRFLPFQNNEAKQWITTIDSGYRLNAMQLVDRDGTRFLGIDAFYAMLPYLPMGRFVSAFLRLPGMFGLARSVYRIIAKNRYRWFGSARTLGKLKGR